MTDRKKRDAVRFLKAMLAMGGIDGPEDNFKSHSKSAGPGMALYDAEARARKKVERKASKAGSPGRRFSAREAREKREARARKRQAWQVEHQYDSRKLRGRRPKLMSRHYASVLRRLQSQQAA